MGSKISSAVQAAMMDDLGNNRLEQLATDDSTRDRRRTFVPRQQLSSQQHAVENPGASRWKKAIENGAFDDTDYRGVKGLDSIESGNAHRRNRETSSSQTYDPANPLGRRGNPGRMYTPTGQNQHSTLPVPGIGRGRGFGVPVPARGSTYGYPQSQGRGYGASPTRNNQTITTNERKRGLASNAPQGLSSMRPRPSSLTISKEPSLMVSRHGARDTSAMGVVPPNNAAKQLSSRKVPLRESNVADGANKQVGGGTKPPPPHPQYKYAPVNKKVESTPSGPQLHEQRKNGENVSRNIAESSAGIPSPSNKNEILYEYLTAQIGLVDGKPRQSVPSTITLYVKPNIDTIFWEIKTENARLRGDIRYCIGPLVTARTVYFRRQEGTADVQNCYVSFSSHAEAEDFVVKMEQLRQRHLNYRGEIFKETFEKLQEPEESSTKKNPSVPEPPKTEVRGKAVAEDLASISNAKSPEESPAISDVCQKQNENMIPASDDLQSIPPKIPPSTVRSQDSTRPTRGNTSKHKDDAEHINHNEHMTQSDFNTSILGHSVESIEKVPAGRYLSCESLRILATITNEDYDIMKKQYQSGVDQDSRTVSQSTSRLSSQAMDMRQKRIALGVVAKWMKSDSRFASLRFGEQKQVCAVAYTNVRRGKKIIRSVDQLLELRPRITRCPQEVAQFNTFWKLIGLSKQHHFDHPLADWGPKSEGVPEKLTEADETKKRSIEERARRAEAEKKRVEEENRAEEEEKARKVQSNASRRSRLYRLVFDNDSSSDDEKNSGQTSSQDVQAAGATQPAALLRLLTDSANTHHNSAAEDGLKESSSRPLATHGASGTKPLGKSYKSPW
ncbi:hypothetical protein F5B19DRAFT_499627 [Rostrohypoxylon terebratum]|nr:hypothetical protein F5B19DRAFT_499627 [Rostrohypoxylon terebratum]